MLTAQFREVPNKCLEVVPATSMSVFLPRSKMSEKEGRSKGLGGHQKKKLASTDKFYKYNAQPGEGKLV